MAWQQAMIWTNADLVHRRIYAPPEFHVLNIMHYNEALKLCSRHENTAR